MPTGPRVADESRRADTAIPNRRPVAVAQPTRPAPASAMRTPAEVVSLQRLAGNRAVTALLPGPSAAPGVSATPAVQRVFTNATNLDNHYQKHVVEQGEYPGLSKAQYNTLSTTLWSKRNTLQSKTAANGRVYVYDSASNDFATFTADGKAITVFKPSGRQSYYDKQV